MADRRRRTETGSTTWMAEGRCRSMPPEVFFPEDGWGVEVAQRICNTCPVQAECLEYALENRIMEGVWGGASQRQRLRLRRERRGQAHRAGSHTGLVGGLDGQLSERLGETQGRHA